MTSSISQGRHTAAVNSWLPRRGNTLGCPDQGWGQGFCAAALRFRSFFPGQGAGGLRTGGLPVWPAVKAAYLSTMGRQPPSMMSAFSSMVRGRAVRICSLISGERTQSYTSSLVWPSSHIKLQERRWKDGPLDCGPCGVDGVFWTYAELTAYLKEYEESYQERPPGAKLSKRRICPRWDGSRRR